MDHIYINVFEGSVHAVQAWRRRLLRPVALLFQLWGR